MKRFHYMLYLTISFLLLLGFSPVGSAQELSDAPATQASMVEFEQVTDVSMRITWTAGDGDGTIVVIKEGSRVDTSPQDGTNYLARASFASGDELGTGNYVIFTGTGTAVDISGLTPGTLYYVAAYAYAGSGTTINYLQTDPATGSRVTQAGSVTGKVFTISMFLPYTETGTSTVSFFEDGFLQFSALNGFGLYSTVGNLFFGSYWAPDVKSQNLLLVFSGVAIGPYLAAFGVATANGATRTLVPWFFLGHAN
jgi:hypothetical protein